MYEPDKPITIYAKYSPFPAYLLESDEGKPLKPSYVILRHRHLVQQQRLIQGLPPAGNPGAKPTRATSVPLPARSAVQATTVSAAHAEDIAPQVPPVTSKSTDTGGSRTVANALPVSAGTISPPAPGPASPSIPSEVPFVLAPEAPHISDVNSREMSVSRQERGIRSRGEKTTWFSSESQAILSAPPEIQTARFGDLYVHSSPHGTKQAWLRTSASQWLSVDLGHPHPYLKGYILNICANGEPSWVTKDTMRTYKGRAKKLEKTQEKKRSPEPGSTSTAHLPSSPATV